MSRRLEGRFLDRESLSFKTISGNVQVYVKFTYSNTYTSTESWSTLVGTYNSPSIVFVIGPIPFTISLSMPLTARAELEVVSQTEIALCCWEYPVVEETIRKVPKLEGQQAFERKYAYTDSGFAATDAADAKEEQHMENETLGRRG